MKLSVVMPHYNHGEYIGRAIAGLRGQTVQPDEVIIIDDCSTDDSVARIETAIADWPAARLIRLPRNIGINAVLNRGLSEVRGRLVYFAAADDVSAAGLVETAVGMFSRWPDAAVVSGVNAFIDENDNVIEIERSALPCGQACFIPPPRAARLVLRHDSWICGGTAVYNADCLKALGGFRADLHGTADSFAARVLALRHGAVFVPEILGYWRRTAAGYASVTSRDKELAASVEQAALALLKTEFANLFPRGYVERFSGRWSYTSAVAALTASGLARTIRQLALFLRYRPYDAGAVAMRRLDHLQRKVLRRNPYRARVPRRVSEAAGEGQTTEPSACKMVQ